MFDLNYIKLNILFRISATSNSNFTCRNSTMFYVNYNGYSREYLSQETNQWVLLRAVLSTRIIFKLKYAFDFTQTREYGRRKKVIIFVLLIYHCRSNEHLAACISSSGQFRIKAFGIWKTVGNKNRNFSWYQVQQITDKPKSSKNGLHFSPTCLDGTFWWYHATYPL